MAVTKTHPIKSTLKAAIDYILNPEKTDGKLLASSFGCGLETADIEFAWTREAAGDRGTHLGRHLIQSFAVGETTPEEAHKIGMELAGAVLGGKYEFVLTTHVDKDHLHNHLIFNAVSFVDYKKYHSNKQSYYHIKKNKDYSRETRTKALKNKLNKLKYRTHLIDSFNRDPIQCKCGAIMQYTYTYNPLEDKRNDRTYRKRCIDEMYKMRLRRRST